MKTVAEWLGTLPEEISKRALKNHKTQFPNGEIINAESLHEAVNRAFPWRGSPEGLAYWRAVYVNAEGNKEQNTPQKSEI